MSILTNRYPMKGERELFFHALEQLGGSPLQHVVDDLHDIFFSQADLIPAIRQWAQRYDIVLDCILCGGTELVQQWKIINDIVEMPIDVPCPFCAKMNSEGGRFE